MAKHVENEYSPDSVSPPGETLQELLAERSLSQAELATRMGRPKKTINEIVKGKAAITPDTALELELVLGVPAPFWNARERNYRASLAQMAQRAREAANRVDAAFPLEGSNCRRVGAACYQSRGQGAGSVGVFWSGFR